MIMLRQRLGKFISYLEKQIYPETEEITDIRMIRTRERFSDIGNLDTSGWERFQKGEIWGGHREYYWFDMRVVIPENFAGKCVCFELMTGKEGGWDATNPQFSCYVDGVLRQGLDVNHREVILSEEAEAGRSYRIVLSAFTGDQNFYLKLMASLKVLDRRTEKYYYDIAVPYQAACLMEPESQASLDIILAVNESVNLVDFRREGSEEYYRSLERAQAYITEEFYGKRCGTGDRPIVCCVGHTHIDCAWLWTLAVTEDKAVRSFSTVLELMRRYPEYRFMSSQPLLYQFVKKNAPEIYEQIRERIREGRWEAEGSMFVEPDCNLSSGESLVRQILYGKRFFREEFGVENEVLWLPDVFGYSAAMPQIMKQSGIRYFMTTKINWNERNRMPYDTFLWRGIDGTEILTHFMPTRDYQDDPRDTRTNFFTTYIGLLNPSHVMGSWKRYTQKYLNKETLMACGYGDGGGGTTPQMLENQRRMAQGIPGCPATKITGVAEFFHRLEADVSGNRFLPKWSGELYLEYHRGTYTTMARNKKYNRRSEFAYENVEWLGMMDAALLGSDYPEQLLRDGWEVILKNQFHDILPGSAIKEVYEDSKREYEEILPKAGEEMARQKQRIADHAAGAPGDVVVFNPYGTAAGGVVTMDPALSGQTGEDFWELSDGASRIPVQRTAEGELLFEAPPIPARGYRSLHRVSAGSGMRKEGNGALLTASVTAMENAYFRLEFSEKGQFSRVFDKINCRDILKAGQAGNVIMSYEDRPHNYDAWDINDYYAEKSWEVDALSSIEVVESGPVRAAVQIDRPYLDSWVSQTVYLYADTPRIDIRTRIDWKEHLIMLKCLFPLDIHAEEAAFEIQYGNVTRPTHSNTSWDSAKFEVCMHKWLDVSECGYGVSVLNDCKYGCSVKDGVVGLTMLKSPVYPNPDADKEMHEFWYSLYPHTGGWREAGTVREAYLFNNPLTAAVKKDAACGLPASYSLLSVDAENVVIEAVKKAEDDGRMVVRMYECYNKRSDVMLSVGLPVEDACACDLLEQDGETLAVEEGRRIRLAFRPYEIKTIKLRTGAAGAI